MGAGEGNKAKVVTDSTCDNNCELLRADEDDDGLTCCVEVRCLVCGIEKEIL